MRITNNMMISTMIRNLGNNQYRLNKYFNQLETGKKISMPSDDPVVAARALKLRTDVAKIEQYQKNIKDTRSWLEASDEALDQMGKVLHRARELSNQAANGTNTPDDLRKIELELKQLKVQVVHLSNSTYAGRYLFSGFKTDRKLMNDDESSPDFGKFNISVSESEKLFYEIGMGDSININAMGGGLFNSRSSVSTSEISSITFPYTVSAANSTIGLSINGQNITADIPAGTYSDYDSLAGAMETAVNTEIDTINAGLPADATPFPAINARLEDGKMTLSVTNTNTAPSIQITEPKSSFFGPAGLNADKTVESKGVEGEVPSMVKLFNDVIKNMEEGNYKGVSDLLDTFDVEMGTVLRVRADIGARENRIDLSEDRMENDYINFTKLKSLNEDADVAEVIMLLKNEENVYRASLAGGTRIIQPSLVDFLR